MTIIKTWQLQLTSENKKGPLLKLIILKSSHDNCLKIKKIYDQLFTNFKTIQIVIKIFEINVLIVKSSSRSTWISNDLINAETWPNKRRCLSIPNFFLIIRIYTGLVLSRRLLTTIKKKMINFGIIISKMLRVWTSNRYNCTSLSRDRRDSRFGWLPVITDYNDFGLRLITGYYTLSNLTIIPVTTGYQFFD